MRPGNPIKSTTTNILFGGLFSSFHVRNLRKSLVLRSKTIDALQSCIRFSISSGFWLKSPYIIFLQSCLKVCTEWLCFTMRCEHFRKYVHACANLGQNLSQLNVLNYTAGKLTRLNSELDCDIYICYFQSEYKWMKLLYLTSIWSKNNFHSCIQ